MADRTLIEVTDATWNPVTGCNPVSPGCRRCYAARFANRLAGRYGYPKEDPFAVTVHRDRMDQPAQWEKPRHVFVCSMGDLFHADIPDTELERIFSVMDSTARHTYMIITKRPRRMARWFADMHPEIKARLARHVWVGVSAEDQERADERIPLLLKAWPGLKLACLEPLLGPVDLARWLDRLDWVICGGETGPGGERAASEHVRRVRDQCLKAGVPFFLKSLGGRGKPRKLDGRLWQQLPAYNRSAGPG